MSPGSLISRSEQVAWSSNEAGDETANWQQPARELAPTQPNAPRTALPNNATHQLGQPPHTVPELIPRLAARMTPDPVGRSSCSDMVYDALGFHSHSLGEGLAQVRWQAS